MTRPSHLTASPETDIFLIDGSSALAVDFLPPEPTDEPTPHLSLVPPLPENTVKLAHETEFENEAQARFARWRGALAVADTVEIQEVEVAPPKTNLKEQIERARAGDEQAEKSVRLNVGRATHEGFFKKNHVTKPVEMERGEKGQLIQFGQSLESVHGNAIIMRPNRHKILKEITEAEALNGQRIQLADERGELEDNYYVVFSVVPDDVPEEQLDHRGDGYFVADLTLAAQATTQTNNKVTTEQGFMAGVETDGNETFDERLEKRIDLEAIAALYRRFNKVAPKTAAELIENGLFIPKHMMPNGVIDVMRWTQEEMDKILGRDIERTVEDYVALREESRRKEASVAEVEEKVYRGLLAAEYSDPMQPVAKMWQLVKDHGVEKAGTNYAIDSTAFGRQAEIKINKSRESYKAGDHEAAQLYLMEAKQVAVISGCGGGAGPVKAKPWWALRDKSNDIMSGEQMNQEQLAEKYGVDKYGVPLAFYCDDCGWLNDRSDPKRKRKDGTYIHVATCGGCKKDVSCGDPDAF